MATIKDMKEWLNQFPDDTVVEFAVQTRGAMYESYGPLEFVEPDFSKNYGDGFEYYDFSNSLYVTQDSPNYGKRFLRFGEPN